MSWTAVVPVRLGSPRKTRLAGQLSLTQREALSDRMFAHVAQVVRSHPDMVETIILSPIAPGTADRWWPDAGRGLNAELQALRARLAGDLLVIHADLPFLGHADITALIATGEDIAIAFDHSGTGTNAVALRAGAPFTFAFGPGSLALHLRGGAVLIDTPGLARDIDHPEDLAFARAQGFAFEV